MKTSMPTKEVLTRLGQRAGAWSVGPSLLACCILAAIGVTVVCAQETAAPHPNWVNAAAGKKVQFGTQPSYAEVTDAEDVKQLVDGRLSSRTPIWYDKATVGWGGPQPIEFTIDLGAVTPIRGVALRVGAGQAGVGWPQQIRILVSDTGERFSFLGDVMKLDPKAPAGDSYEVRWLRADQLKTHGRYVRFAVTPRDTGNGIYFFVDEVQVWRGDAAFLKLPLPEPERLSNPESPEPQLENMARDAAIKFEPPPNDPGTTDADDAKQLVDGKLSPATPIWSDKSAVGWAALDSAGFTVDLGAVRPIRGVAIRAGAGQAGVEWPASVQFYVSESGERFTPLGDLMGLLTERPPQQVYAPFWLRTDKLQTHGRFVKFVFATRNLGSGAYVFIDELEIYRGEDAWLAQPIASVEAPQQWTADWSQIQWQDQASATPQGERPSRLQLVDGETVLGADDPLQQARVDANAVTFSLKGEASKPRSMSWTAPLTKPVSAEKCRYAVLTFQASGIRRTYEPRSLVALHGIGGEAAANAITLLEANMGPNDGRSHTLIRQLPEGFTLQQLKVAIYTEDDAPRLTLQRLELLSEIPQVFGADVPPGGAVVTKSFHTVDLGALANTSYSSWSAGVLAKHKILMDGVRTLPAGTLMMCGVPFAVASDDRNLAAMPESAPSDKRVEFMGHMVEERFLEPKSRHDQLSVSVDAQAREAFLLLALSAAPVQVLGGQPHTALHLDDIESLSVELTYDRGDSTIAFPYSLADKGCYIPYRLVGAYAVAVDPSRRLRKVTLHNRHYGPNFALAALTLNTSPTPVVPELASLPDPQRTRVNPPPANRGSSVARDGNRLTFSNRWYECRLDLSNGFVMDRYVNRWNESAAITLGKSSGLRVRFGDSIYTGRSFKAEVVRAAHNSAELKLTSTRPELPLELMVTVSVDESPELSFVVQSRNRGSEPLAAELCIPALDALSIGDAGATRLFFPQYRNVDTAEPIALRAPYGPEYTTQFMDVYSRPAGVGIMFRTSNAEQQMVTYALRKDDIGVAGGICFPADYNVLEPDAVRKHIPVSLIAHGGDWRTAFALYRDWLRTWHKPVRSQDKGYFLNAWEIACYRPSDVISWQDTKVPPFITADRTRFLTEETFEFEKKVHGHKPDLVHFFNWTYNDKKKRNEYGVFGTPLAYEQVGGIEFFRKGIEDMQMRLNTPLSLYTLIDRFRASALPDQALSKELVANAWHQEPDKDSDASSHLRASGQPDGIYFVRFGHERWTESVIADIVKMQRDTGCKMVYIDVFAYWSHLKGHNGTSPRTADLMVLKKLRDRLPPDVAIWSEYPPTDFGAQYADGALQYYFLHLNEVFARRYNFAGRSYDVTRELPISIGRYALPRFKNIGLAGYIEASNSPSQVDAMFVNGEANQEDTWRLHHSRVRERLNRAYEVKREYNDCFTSDDPSPWVDTEATGIIANRFPGAKRTVWTLFNARPATFSGVVLAIPHLPGAKYRDAWNDKELSPTIENGVARISMRIDPQQPGCVVQLN